MLLCVRQQIQQTVLFTDQCGVPGARFEKYLYNKKQPENKKEVNERGGNG